jgi:hypothetical protein
MNKYSDYKIHPVANIFPLMDDAAYETLKADIAANGQWEMIMMHDEQIIDGRNRLKACCELGIEPNIGELPIELDPYRYAVSVNLHRRHLTVTQRSDVAAHLATLRRGEAGNGREVELHKCSSTISDAATLLSVSPRSVAAASYVHDHGCKELIAGLSSGAIPVTLAEKFCKEFTDKKEQAKIAKGGTKAIKEAMKGDKPKSPEDAGSAKAAAKAAKEQAKAEAVAAKALAKAEAAGVRQKIKDDAAEDKAEAKAAKEAAKVAALTIEGQAKNIANLIQQYIDKAVRSVDDLNFVKPNPVACKAAVKLLQGVKLW